MRAGDIARATVAAGPTGIRVTTVFATNVLERVYDLFAQCPSLPSRFYSQKTWHHSSTKNGRQLAFWRKDHRGVGHGRMALFGFPKTRCRIGPVQSSRPSQTDPAEFKTSPAHSSKGCLPSVCTLHTGRGSHFLLLWFNLNASSCCSRPFTSLCHMQPPVHYRGNRIGSGRTTGPGYLGVFQGVIEVTLTIWTASALFTPGPRSVGARSKSLCHRILGCLLCACQSLGLLCLRRAGLSLKEPWSQARSAPRPRSGEA